MLKFFVEAFTFVFAIIAGTALMYIIDTALSLPMG